MISKYGSISVGTGIFASAILVLCAYSMPAQSETVVTVNGKAIDSVVVDSYIQSRLNRPAAQASAEERQQLTAEVTDIYVLATQDEADEVLNDPVVQAQIELQRVSLLAQAVAQKFYAGISVSEEEIQAEYEVQIKLSPTLQFKARHILVETQSEAVSLIEQLIDGADFAELAMEYSTGPSGPDGGDLGWFTANQMVAPFSNAVAALGDGRFTTDPVQTDFGWHVILREDSRPAEPPTLESARENITRAVQNKKFQEYLAGIKENAVE